MPAYAAQLAGVLRDRMQAMTSRNDRGGATRSSALQAREPRGPTHLTEGVWTEALRRMPEEEAALRPLAEAAIRPLAAIRPMAETDIQRRIGELAHNMQRTVRAAEQLLVERGHRTIHGPSTTADSVRDNVQPTAPM